MPNEGVALTTEYNLMNNAIPHYHKSRNKKTGARYLFRDRPSPLYKALIDDKMGSAIRLDSGAFIEHRVQTKVANPTARVTGLHNPVVHRETATILAGQIHWGMYDGGWTYNKIKRDMMSGSGGSIKLIDYMKSQYVPELEGMYFKKRDHLVEVPYSPTDRVRLYSPFMFMPITKVNEADSEGGFNGNTLTYGDGTESTSIFGIDRAVFPDCATYNWNHNGRFDGTYKRRFRRARSKTNYSLPEILNGKIEAPSVEYGNYKTFVDEDFYLDYESHLNTGVSSMSGKDLNPHVDGFGFSSISMVMEPGFNALSHSPQLTLNLPEWELFKFQNFLYWHSPARPTADIHQLVQDFMSIIQIQSNAYQTMGWSCSMRRTTV